MAQTWFIAGGFVLVEICLLWLIRNALRRGIATINFGNSAEANDIFNITVHRATYPIIYWLMVGIMMGGALAVGAGIIILLKTGLS
jgi:hypothetical protein